MAYNGPPQRHVAPSPKVLRKVQTLQQLNAVVAQLLEIKGAQPRYLKDLTQVKPNRPLQWVRGGRN